MPGTILGTLDIPMNKTHQNACSHGAYFQGQSSARWRVKSRVYPTFFSDGHKTQPTGSWLYRRGMQHAQPKTNANLLFLLIIKVILWASIVGQFKFSKHFMHIQTIDLLNCCILILHIAELRKRHRESRWPSSAYGLTRDLVSFPLCHCFP